MTKVVVMALDGVTACGWYDDPRSLRDVMAAINTGVYVPECDKWPTRGPAYAQLSPNDPETVNVYYAPLKVRLYTRLYHVLWAASEGKKTSQVAEELGISIRTVYAYHQELKWRFDARSMYAVVAIAEYMKLVQPKPKTRLPVRK